MAKLEIAKNVSFPHRDNFGKGFCSSTSTEGTSAMNCIVYITNLYNYTNLSLVFLLISNLTNGLHLHQFLVTLNTEANKSIENDANGAH